MSISLPDDVRAALVADDKIEAIRLLRQRTGLGLAEAKAAVESAEAVTSTSNNVDRPAEFGWQLPDEAKAALEQGKVLQAIRLLRTSKGLGLKDAKTIVDAARGMPARADGRAPLRVDGRSPSGLAPGEVPRSRVSAGIVVVLLLAVVALLWLMRTD